MYRNKVIDLSWQLCFTHYKRLTLATNWTEQRCFSSSSTTPVHVTSSPMYTVRFRPVSSASRTMTQPANVRLPRPITASCKLYQTHYVCHRSRCVHPWLSDGRIRAVSVTCSCTRMGCGLRFSVVHRSTCPLTTSSMSFSSQRLTPSRWFTTLHLNEPLNWVVRRVRRFSLWRRSWRAARPPQEHAARLRRRWWLSSGMRCGWRRPINNLLHLPVLCRSGVRLRHSCPPASLPLTACTPVRWRRSVEVERCCGLLAIDRRSRRVCSRLRSSHLNEWCLVGLRLTWPSSWKITPNRL